MLRDACPRWPHESFGHYEDVRNAQMSRGMSFCPYIRIFREGANREKLTVKRLIDNEMFFLSPFMSLTNREKSA